MADELISYYEKYKTTFGSEGYSMARCEDTSRVLTLVDWVKKYVKPGGRVLDVGCGDMHLSTLLPDYEWVGIDVAPDMSNGKAVKHDLMTTPYPLAAQSFDAAICSEVLEHVWDLRVVNAEVRRLLKPQGHYLMSTPNFDWMDHHIYGFRQLLFTPEHKHLFEHIRQYNYETHSQFLDEAGFKVLEYTGADAQYGNFFAGARQALFHALMAEFGRTLPGGAIDQLLGAMFPKCSHTIMFAAQKS